MRNSKRFPAVQMSDKSVGPNAGFTLVELLVVIAIVGVLMGLLLPSVQYVRESARRTTCANNLRQIGLGLGNYESAYKSLPMGAEFGTGHSWSSRTLGYLEQESLRTSINFSKPWDDVINQPAVFSPLTVFSCPTSFKTYSGSTDYCGIAGSYLTQGGSVADGKNGILFIADSAAVRPVKFADVKDGLSTTISVGEGVAVTEENFGYWGCGWHCLTHEDGGVSNRDGGYNEIASLHPGGANVVFCDGSVRFLDASISEEVISALCTRAGAELLGDF